MYVYMYNEELDANGINLFKNMVVDQLRWNILLHKKVYYLISNYILFRFYLSMHQRIMFIKRSFLNHSTSLYLMGSIDQLDFSTNQKS